MPHVFDADLPCKELPRAPVYQPEGAACPQILQEQPAIGWFEIHPENYMGAGGHAAQNALANPRALCPVHVHGVGLSIGGADALDKNHLDRLKISY